MRVHSCPTPDPDPQPTTRCTRLPPHPRDRHNPGKLNRTNLTILLQMTVTQPPTPREPCAVWCAAPSVAVTVVKVERDRTQASAGGLAATADPTTPIRPHTRPPPPPATGAIMALSGPIFAISNPHARLGLLAPRARATPHPPARGRRSRRPEGRTHRRTSLPLRILP